MNHLLRGMKREVCYDRKNEFGDSYPLMLFQYAVGETTWLLKMVIRPRDRLKLNGKIVVHFVFLYCTFTLER